MTSPWEWAASGTLVTAAVGMATLAVKSAPDWVKMRAQRRDIAADTAIKIQGMTLEYAETMEKRLKDALSAVERLEKVTDTLRANLEAANEENARYRARVAELPPEHRAIFTDVA